MAGPLHGRQCATLKAQLLELQRELQQDQAHLSQLIATHASASQIQEWSTVVGLKSQEVTAARRELLTLGCLQPSTPPRPASWSQADTEAILSDGTAGAWHAGHVRAILTVGKPVTDTLLGTDSGGVWRIHTPSSGTPGRPVNCSNTWDNPDVMCLAHGVDGPAHVYVGCHTLYGSPAAIYESNPLAPDPLSAWIAVTPPAGIGSVYAIATDAASRRIVAVGDGGVWWSPIPAVSASAPTRTYQWTQAFNQGCSGLAIVGPGFVPVVSTWGGTTLIATGTWAPGFAWLTFIPRPSPNLVTPAIPQLGRSSLAAAPSNPQRLYCVVSAAGSLPQVVNGKTIQVTVPEVIAGLLTSPDGGRTWSALSPTVISERQGASLPSVAGAQGHYNNCIAVSPADPATVVVGWQFGFFLSQQALATGGAASWKRFLPNPHLHADVHALYFEPSDTSGQTLHIGSDGGYVVTPDLGLTFDSGHNRYLLNLQFMSTLERGLYGTFAASPLVPNLVAGGLQDNGVAYNLLGSGPWKRETGADGKFAIFLQSGQLISCPQGGVVGMSRWDAASKSMVGRTDLTRTDTTGAAVEGLRDPAAEVIDVPTQRRAGRLLFVAAGYGQEPNVAYGLFANDDGTNPAWAPLGVLTPWDIQIWSVASHDGSTIAVGTANPATVWLITGTGSFPPASATAVSPAPRPAASVGTGELITRILVMADSSLLCAFNGSTRGELLHGHDAGQGRWAWETLPVPDPSARIYGLAADKRGRIYVASDSHVWTSVDGGKQWSPFSEGLPVRFHGADLRCAANPDGSVTVYLSTFGRSVWKRTLS